MMNTAHYEDDVVAWSIEQAQASPGRRVTLH